jgi:flavodoxin
MNTLVMYDSKYGNTKKIAEVITEQLAASGSARLFNVEEGKPDLKGVDLLVVGGPTWVHGWVRREARKAVKQFGDLKGLACAAFDTRLPGDVVKTGAASVGIAKALESKGGKLVAPPESFIVTESEGPLKEGELEHSRAWAAKLVPVMAS